MDRRVVARSIPLETAQIVSNPADAAEADGSQPARRNASRIVVGTLPRAASLSDQVIAELETLIVEGRLAPGALLPAERELGLQFGVSRTVIREATRVLAAKGLVDVSNGRGTVVRAATAEAAAEALKLLMRRQTGGLGLEKVIEVRRVLEVHIAGLSAERRTDTDLAAMERWLAVAQGHLADPDAFVRADVGFHTALAAATHNELFPTILDSLSVVLTTVRQLALRVSDTPPRALAHHRAIFAAVHAGSVLDARAAMDAHMDEALETLQEVEATEDVR